MSETVTEWFACDCCGWPYQSRGQALACCPSPGGEAA